MNFTRVMLSDEVEVHEEGNMIVIAERNSVQDKYGGYSKVTLMHDEAIRLARVLTNHFLTEIVE